MSNTDYQREWARNNKDKVAAIRKRRAPKASAYQKAWRASNPELYMWHGSKNRAKRYNLAFNIEPTDILIPECCPLLNIPLQLNHGSIKKNFPTIDRLDNSKGYIKGNIWVISMQANVMKNSASLLELEMLVKNLKIKLTKKD